MTGEAGTGGGDRGRQKLRVSGGLGHLFRVYIKHVQECKRNMAMTVSANTFAEVCGISGRAGEG